MRRTMTRWLILVAVSTWTSYCFGDVAVIDSNYLKQSSAASKAIWAQWGVEVKTAKAPLEIAEITKRHALSEEDLHKRIEAKVLDYLANVKKYDTILDLSKDKKAKEAFSANAELTLNLLKKIDVEWFPAQSTTKK